MGLDLSTVAGVPPSACRVALAGFAFAIAVFPGLSHAALSAEEGAALATRSPNKVAPHGDAALRVARQLGVDKRIDGLEAIVAMGAPRLVDMWRDGLASSTLANDRGVEAPREVAAVEVAVLAQMAKAKSDAKMTDALAQVFSIIRWRSRQTFDVLKARVIGPVWPPGTRFQPLLNTANPELGEPLFALRDAIPTSMRQPFLAAMTRLKVKAALPFVERTLLTRQPGDLFVGDLSRTLLALDDRFPPPALLARISQDLKDTPESPAQQDAAMVLAAIADDKGGRPLDYRALRASLGTPVPSHLREGLVRIIQAHRVTEGREDLVALVAAGGGNSAAFAASVAAAMPDPDLWKRTLEAARSTKARESESRYLDQSIAQMEKNLAQGTSGAETMKRDAAARDVRMRLVQASERFNRLLMGPETSAEAGAELDGAIADWKKTLDGVRPVGKDLETSLQDARYLTAIWYRFRRADARRALADFEHLAQEGRVEAAIAAADTLQHEFGDAKGALARFEALLARRKSEKAASWGTGNFVVSESWLRRWLEAEIAQLKGGKRFGGLVTSETAQQASAAAFLLEAGMSWRQSLRHGDDPARAKAVLAEIRASKPTRFAVASLLALLAYPGTNELSADLLRNDPTGFLSGQLIGNLLVNSDPGRSSRPPTFTPDQAGSAHRAAEDTAKGLTKATGMRFKLEPDSTYATPEKTWNAFLAALCRGDREAAGACLTSVALENWTPVLGKLSAADMKAMADTVRTFAPTVQLETHAEYAVGREGGNGGSVSFVKQYGEWKISQL